MKGAMKWVIPLAIAAVASMFYLNINNRAIEKQEEAQTRWSDVESAYQRRSDLIPNLVNTVKGAADFERGTLTEVIEARSKATAVNVNAQDLNEESIQAFQKAQEGLSSALSRLMVTVERYPELKATENFKAFQSQLEGTENRINVSRNRYNEAVRQYNVYIRQIPQNMVARLAGFKKMARFEAAQGAEQAPEVNFDS